MAEGVDLTPREENLARSLTPGSMLALVTGSSEEPLSGFKPRPFIGFDLAETKLPVVSACTNSLTFYNFPGLKDPAKFVKTMITLFANGTFFSAA